MTFDASDNAVYFYTDSTIYSFVEKSSDVVSDTIDVPIKLIGNIDNNTARTLDIVVDSTNAVEGQDFDILSPTVLEADSNYAHLKVLLYRTEDLQTDTKVIVFKLNETSDFKIAQLGGSRNTHMVKFSDQYVMPSWWTTYLYGAYTLTRHKFYIDVFGSSKSYTEMGLAYGTVLYMLRAATIEYNKTHSSPLSDENGVIVWENASGAATLNW